MSQGASRPVRGPPFIEATTATSSGGTSTRRGPLAGRPSSRQAQPGGAAPGPHVAARSRTALHRGPQDPGSKTFDVMSRPVRGPLHRGKNIPMVMSSFLGSRGPLAGRPSSRPGRHRGTAGRSAGRGPFAAGFATPAARCTTEQQQPDRQRGHARLLKARLRSSRSSVSAVGVSQEAVGEREAPSQPTGPAPGFGSAWASSGPPLAHAVAVGEGITVGSASAGGQTRSPLTGWGRQKPGS